MADVEVTQTLKIGVLALQGAFAEHVAKLEQLNVRAKEVRTPKDLEDIDGLIIPGGESTSMVLIAESSGMMEPLREYVSSPSHAVWGTCAGLILLSDQLENAKQLGGARPQPVLGGLHVTTCRNYFGRQLNSFVTQLPAPPALLTLPEVPSDVLNTRASEGYAVVSPEQKSASPDQQFEAVFIRAPAITSVDNPDVEVLATVDKPSEAAEAKTTVVVAVRQGRLLGTAFHPELTQDLRWHALFVQMAHNLLKQQGTNKTCTMA